jgi:hypothetical protein
MEINSRLLYLATVLGMLPGIAAAGTVYTNLAPTDPPFTCCGGWVISGPDSLIPFLPLEQPAFAFQSAGNFQFTELDLAVGWMAGTNRINVELTADSGNVPGPILESWIVDDLPSVLVCCSAESLTYAAGSSAGAIYLTAGSQYWVVVRPAAADTVAAWAQNNIGVAGLAAGNNGSGFLFSAPETSIGAFAVQGTPTPEPATWQLAALAALSAIVLRPRLGSQIRALAQPVAHVPRRARHRD